MKVEMAKLIAGSCPQLVFQAVLLGGYTSWSADFSGKETFPCSQAASIFMSALMIGKSTTEIVIYQREMHQPESPTKYHTLHEWVTILVDKPSTGKEFTAPKMKTMKDWMRSMVEQLKKFLIEVLKKLWSILPLLPFVLSSLIFNTGTLVLTIIVTEWYSAIYIGIVLLLNLTISFSFPFSIARRAEEKLGVSYKFSKTDEAEKLKETRILRGIFATWGNLFIFLRPVENISYHKIVHVSLLQPLRFLVNIVTLIIVFYITWTAKRENSLGKLENLHKHNRNQMISLILTFATVLAAGVLNMAEFRYFYKKERHTKPSHENVPDEEEEPPPLLLHSTSVQDEDNLDTYLHNFPSQAVPSQPVNLSMPESTSNGQFTLTTTRQSKKSITSVTSRKSVTEVSQSRTVQEGVQLEGALADEKSPLLSIAEKGNPDDQMVPYDEEGFQTNDDSPTVLTEYPDGEMSVSETEVVGPDGTVYTKKVSVRSIKKLSINGKDVNLDNLDDPNSNLTEEEKLQIRLACQNQGVMAIAES